MPQVEWIWRADLAVLDRLQLDDTLMGAVEVLREQMPAP
jgi:hypothetical protein